MISCPRCHQSEYRAENHIDPLCWPCRRELRADGLQWCEGCSRVVPERVKVAVDGIQRRRCPDCTAAIPKRVGGVKGSAVNDVRRCLVAGKLVHVPNLAALLCYDRVTVGNVLRRLRAQGVVEMHREGRCWRVVRVVQS